MKNKRIYVVILAAVVALTLLPVAAYAFDDPNYGLIDEILPGETLNDNYNTVFNNYGTVFKNYGTVERNHNYIEENYGTVNNNYTAVEYNYGGTIYNDGGGVRNNYGGTVTNQPADKDFHEVTVVGGENATISGLEDANSKKWIEENSTATITANTGYTFVGAPTLNPATGGTITQNGNSYELSDVTEPVTLTLSIISSRKPTASANRRVYANGNALIIKKTDGDDTAPLTTIYIDANRDGDHQLNEPSLMTVGIAYAPADSADLSDYEIFGGCNAATDSCDDTMITMLSGKVKYIFGGGYNGRVDGNTSVTISDGEVSNILGGNYRGSVGGNATIEIKGGKVSDTVHGGGWYAAISGHTSVTISGGTLNQNVYGGGYESSVTDGASVSITGGTVMGNVYSGGHAATATVTGPKTVSVSGSPVVGGATTGVQLGTITTKTVTVTDTLAYEARIHLLNPSDVTDGTVVATAAKKEYVSAANFAIRNYPLKKVDKGAGAEIQIGQDDPMPTVDTAKRYIYANGNALIIQENTPGTGKSTIYIDTNRSGSLDTGEPSLSQAGVTGAPANDADLSGYKIFGGCDTDSSGDTMITMLSGKVNEIFGGGNGGAVNGNTSVTVSGGTVMIGVFGGGSNGAVNGNTKVTFSGGTLDDIYGGGFGQTATVSGNASINISGGRVKISVNGGGYGAAVTGNKTVSVSGTPVVGSEGGGVALNSITGGTVTVTGALTSEARIVLSYPPVVTAGTVVATAAYKEHVAVDNFVLVNRATCYTFKKVESGASAEIQIDQAYTYTKPTSEAGGMSLFANGTALLIVGTDATHTTVYIDANRSGTLDAGEPSLIEAGAVTAPENNADLIAYSVYGGGNTDGSYDTMITMLSGRVDCIYGGGYRSNVTGSTSVTVKGGEAIDIFGGSNGGTVSGDSSISITGGTVTGGVNGGGSGTSTVSGNKTVSVSGSPVIGYGIQLDSLTSGSVTVSGAITSGTVIPLADLPATAAGTVVATAAIKEHVAADNFAIQNYHLKKVDKGAGAEIQIDYAHEPPTVVGADVFGNGTALVIVKTGDDNGKPLTTIYIDANRNGKYDTGEKSLKDAGVAGAPGNNTNLSAYIVYGGGKMNTDSCGGTMITMLSGKVFSVMGGGDSGVVNGNTSVTIHDGDVGMVAGGGLNGNVDGNTSVVIKGGKISDILCGGGSVGAVTGNTSVVIEGGEISKNIYGGSAGNNATVSGVRTVSVSGSPVIVNGIQLQSITDEKVTVSGALSVGTVIPLLNPSAVTASKVVAEASDKGYVSADNFTLRLGSTKYLLKKVESGTGAEIQIQATPMVNSSRQIFANGAALIIQQTGDNNGTPLTAIYIDTNRDGKLDMDEKSLKDAGIPNAPENKADLSQYSVYGGCYASTDSCDNTMVTMISGKVMRILGGGSSGVVNGDTSITVSGGEVGIVIGGGEVMGVGEVNGNTSVTVKGGTIGNIYGGGQLSTIKGNTSVAVKGGNIVGNVYGGGGSGQSGTVGTAGGNNTASVTISQQDDAVPTTIGGNVYGGGMSGSAYGDTSVTISGGTLNNNVYGGGAGANANVSGSAAISISGGTVTGSVYGGGEHINAAVGGAKTVAVSAAPVIGAAGATPAGIQLNSISSGQVTISGALTGTDGAIKLMNPTSATANTVVATAATVAHANAKKFELLGVEGCGLAADTTAGTVYIAGNSYTVVFNKNATDATGSMPDQSFTYGTEQALTANKFVRTGYDFAGWARSATGDMEYSDNASVKDLTDESGSTVTLYAVWTVRTYPVTLNRNGGAADGSVIATYGMPLPTFTALTRADYTLNGYYTAASGGVMVIDAGGVLQKNVSGYSDAAGTWSFDDAATLYAQWTLNSYNVTLYDNDAGITGFQTSTNSTDGVDGAWTAYATPVSVSHGGSLWVKAMLGTGYTFDKWASGITENPYKITNITADVEYTPSSNAPITASVSPDAANFDKYTPSDLKFTLNPGTYSLIDILKGASTLVYGTDYTVSGNEYTISQSYLSAQPVGSVPLTFNMNAGRDPTVSIDVSDTTPTKLATPTNLAWDSSILGKATWGAVEDAGSYSVHLYKDGELFNLITTISPRYDFSANIKTGGTGSYTFKITAIRSSAAYANSDESAASAACIYTAGALKYTIEPSSSIEAGKATDIIFTIGDDTWPSPSDLKEVSLGGVILNPPIDCTVTSGSIVITLKKIYLNTLKPGIYTLRATMHSGAYAETQITVFTRPPKTGDGSTPLIWLSLCLLCGAGLALMIRRKHRA